MKSLPIVAIVGRANVGKSSLFNAVLASREAIVAKEAGTTRDSIAAKAHWNKQDFWLVDTAGVKEADDAFELTIQEQIIQAAHDADVIWVVVEADVPVTEEDRRVAKLALRNKKTVFLVINKADRAKGKDLSQFVRLGIKDITETSSTQHMGIERLLNSLTKQIPKISQKDDPRRLKVAILGRPNVGKSYLFNTLAKKQQAIVADRAGTTRDINRSVVKYKGREIELMDTAGIRRSGKVERGVEYFSVLRALSAIEQASVVLLLMTPDELNVQLDQKLAGMVKDSGKGLVLVVSKWDTVPDKETNTQDELAKRIAYNFDFVPWAPLIFTSAETGQNVAKLFDLVVEIEERRHQIISTSALNKWLREAVDKHPPAGLKSRTPKLNYMVQETDNSCPSFKIFGSSTKYVHWSYRRYLERKLREVYDFNGTPLQLWFIEKHIAHPHGVRLDKEFK